MNIITCMKNISNYKHHFCNCINRNIFYYISKDNLVYDMLTYKSKNIRIYFHDKYLKAWIARHGHPKMIGIEIKYIKNHFIKKIIKKLSK